MIVEAGPEIGPIPVDEIRGQIVAFAAFGFRLVLFESFLRSFARHSNIEAFQHPVELWIGRAESGIFSKHFFRKFDYVNLVTESRQGNVFCRKVSPSVQALTAVVPRTLFSLQILSILRGY